MYYPSSENKGADQLRGYREADLRLCFRLCKLLVFPCGGSIMYSYIPISGLIQNVERSLFHDVAQIHAMNKGLQQTGDLVHLQGKKL